MTLNKEVLRFLGAGLIVTATDFSIYFILIRFVPVSVAKGISFTCAGIVGYLLNKYWTFKQKESSYGEVGRYWLVNFIALGINILVNQAVLKVWPEGVVVALIVTTIVTSVFTYVGFKWWVFKPGKKIH